jgi:hypothetical protein
MKRKFYFIKDTVTGQFYTGQENDIADFSEAAVYYSNASAEKKIKSIIEDWDDDHQFADSWINDAKKGVGTSLRWAKEKKNNVLKRQNLDQWGMEIVSVEVKAP